MKSIINSAPAANEWPKPAPGQENRRRDRLFDQLLDLFHNPFRSVDALRSVAWVQTTFYNRLYLVMGSVITTLFALLRLQNREKFI